MRWKIGFAAVVFVMTFMYAEKTALACKGSEVIYEDSFGSLDPAWGEPNVNLSVENGKLVLQPEINKSWTVINQANIFEDMDACVKVSLAKSDNTNYGGGLVFWSKDYSDYYYLMITGDGWFTVKRWVNSRVLEPVPWREHASLKKGLGEVNQIRLVTKGTQATVYLNDTEIVSFKGQPPQGGSFVGFTANSPTDAQNKNVWEFTDLKITKP